MFIKCSETYIGIRKHETHEIGSGTKLFITLEFDMRRERHNLSMLTAFTSSALNPTNARRP